jgi:hypothetical protein
MHHKWKEIIDNVGKTTNGKPLGARLLRKSPIELKRITLLSATISRLLSLLIVHNTKLFNVQFWSWGKCVTYFKVYVRAEQSAQVQAAMVCLNILVLLFVATAGSWAGFKNGWKGYELGNRREGQGYHLWLVMLTRRARRASHVCITAPGGNPGPLSQLPDVTLNLEGRADGLRPKFLWWGRSLATAEIWDLNLWRQKYTDGRLWIVVHHACEPIEGSHVSETL